MRKILFIFVCLMIFGFKSPAGAFEAGEKINYNVLQMGVKVAQASLTFVGEVVYKNQKMVLIEFHAQGMNFLDDEKIYLDTVRNKPLFVERDLNIFGRREKIVEQYTDGHIKIAKNVNGNRTLQIIDKAGWMDNIYAFIYRFRSSIKAQVGDKFDINLPTKDVRIELLKKDNLKVAGQNYEVDYLQSKPSKYKVWIDTSAQRLPLRISGAIGLANTAMVMTSYEK